ncbi:MAG: PEP-CTERM sorting domain-containing protein [Myxococcota bacterium]
MTQRPSKATKVLFPALLFFDAVSASAITFATVGETTRSVEVGDVITLEFNVDNFAGPGSQFEGVLSLRASASGFGGSDLTGLQLINGQSAFSYLRGVCVSPDLCLDFLAGWDNSVDNQNLTQQTNGNVAVIDADSGSAPSADGSFDWGYDGTFDTSDVALTFLVTGAVNGVELGTQLPGDAVSTPNGSFDVASASYTINVVPEPGTALLLGLGMIGLALRKPRHATSATNKALSDPQ